MTCLQIIPTNKYVVFFFYFLSSRFFYLLGKITSEKVGFPLKTLKLQKSSLASFLKTSNFWLPSLFKIHTNLHGKQEPKQE